jgi:hypothetical protein
VWNLRKRRAWNRSADPTTDDGQRLDRVIGTKYPQTVAAMRTPEMRTALASQNAEITRILSLPEFAPIDAAFRTARGRRSYDVNWYQPCGPTSIAQLAKDVDMESHYQTFYSKWSEAAHSYGFFDHIYVDDAGPSIEQVRNFEDIGYVIGMAHATAHGVFRLFIDHYRPGEVRSFCLKYVKEWRVRALQIPKVTVNRKERE